MLRSLAALLFTVVYCTALAVPQRAVRVNENTGPRQYVEENLATKLLEDPNNVELLLKMGALKMDDAGPLHDGDKRTAALDDAQSSYERVVAIDSNNTTALYSLGVLGWMRVFPALRAARAQLAMDPETPGPLRDRATRAVLNARYGRTLGDSIAYLERVFTVDPQNNDSMGYLNLVFRAKADLDESAAAYREDIASADRWVQKALETGRAKPPAPKPEMSRPPLPRPENGPIRLRAVNFVHQVSPVYTEEMRKADLRGTVRLDATISKDGTIQNLQILSGHLSLVQPAVDAVKQWVAQPTRLNGEAVEVISTVDVDFGVPPGQEPVR